MLDLAVLVLFYNKEIQTLSCIKSFLNSGVKIYVLNNGSNQNSFNNLKSKFSDHKQVFFFDSKKNKGPAWGRNYLIQNTQEKWLFAVDNDIILSHPSDWLVKLKLHIEKDDSIDIFIPSTFNLHENAYSIPFQLKLINNRLIEVESSEEIVNNFPGGASIVNRKVFENYGLYDENIFIGFEDVEFSIRALVEHKKPLRCKKIYDIELIHDHQLVKNKDDLYSVYTRYDDRKIDNDFNYLTNKHNIQYDHDWRSWTRKQRKIMTGGRKKILFSKLFKKLLILLKSIVET
jgi:GT2 family glycosyltransferase